VSATVQPSVAPPIATFVRRLDESTVKQDRSTLRSFAGRSRVERGSSGGRGFRQVVPCTGVGESLYLFREASAESMMTGIDAVRSSPRGAGTLRSLRDRHVHVQHNQIGRAVALTRPDTPCSEVINRMWADARRDVPSIAHCRCCLRCTKPSPTPRRSYPTMLSRPVSSGEIGRGRRERQLEPEGRTDARSTLDAERATNRLHQSSGERQTQPVPSIPWTRHPVDRRARRVVRATGVHAGPVSVTRSRRRSATSSLVRVTDPPAWLYLMAFDRRLTSDCLRCRGSARTGRVARTNR